MHPMQRSFTISSTGTVRTEIKTRSETLSIRPITCSSPCLTLWQWLKEKIEELSLPPEAFLLSPVMNYIWDYIGDAVEKAVQFEERAVEELSAAGLSRLAEKQRQKSFAFTSRWQRRQPERT